MRSGLGVDDPSFQDSSNCAGCAKRVRVLLADDHQAILDRVATLLAADFTVVGAVSSGEDVVHAASRLQPDVLVLDISMPGLSGLEAATRVKGAGSSAVTIFLTVHDAPEFLQAAWEAGALGYVSKSHLGTDLIPAIRAALDRRRFVSPSIERDAGL